MKESPFLKNTGTSCGATRPLTKEESDANAKLNALGAERYELEKRIHKASIASAEADLEMSKCRARLHSLAFELSNLKVERPANA